jgi:hypothetical protein
MYLLSYLYAGVWCIRIQELPEEGNTFPKHTGAQG